MCFEFKARIYKVGINPCVKVPYRITNKMKPTKGYIAVNGTIECHSFKQTLVPVKDQQYRLYVNGPMLKGSSKKVGDRAHFIIEQDFTPQKEIHPMSPALKAALEKHRLMPVFEKLIPSRQKEIIRYLNFLKTEEAFQRNLEKVISQLKKLNSE